MFEASTYDAVTTTVRHGDLLVLYSERGKLFPRLHARPPQRTHDI